MIKLSPLNGTRRLYIYEDGQVYYPMLTNAEYALAFEKMLKEPRDSENRKILDEMMRNDLTFCTLCNDLDTSKSNRDRVRENAKIRCDQIQSEIDSGLRDSDGRLLNNNDKFIQPRYD